MPTKKQRRRSQKARRHEYEYVYVDDQGEEIPLEEVEPGVAQRNGAAKTKGATSRDGRSKPRGSTAGAQAGGRAVKPPSWERVLKRAAVFAPFMFGTIWLIDRRLGVPGVLLVTLQMLVIFIPFSYLLDRTMYRRLLRQTGATPAKATRRRS